MSACLHESRSKTSLKSIRSDDSAQVKLPIPLSYLPKLAWHFHLGPLKDDIHEGERCITLLGGSYKNSRILRHEGEADTGA